MTKAVHKISFSPIRDIPFNKLMLSEADVRRLHVDNSIEDLANDIERRGLLQSLNVRPVVDNSGEQTGMFEIPAVGRRFRALELLVKQKRLVRELTWLQRLVTLGKAPKSSEAVPTVVDFCDISRGA